MFDPAYTPDTYLRMKVIDAGTEMIKYAGMLKAYLKHQNMDDVSDAENHIEIAAQNAIKAIEKYKRVISIGRNSLTREEWNAL